MAITQNTYTGNGSTTNYSFTFPYLETTDIKVSVNGVNTTAYTLANPTTVSFNTAPANGAAIRIYRDTDDSALAATFYPGSAIRSQDLNDNFTQNLYVVQEINNNAVQIDGSQTMVGDLDMGGYQINNLAEPTVDDDAATKYYIDQRYGSTTIPAHTRWRKTATAGQTTFSGTGDYGGTLTYSALREQVYLNGALQQRSADYTADNGTSIVFSVPLTVGDVVDVVCVNNTNTSGISNAANLSYSGQFSGQTVRTVAAKLADVVSVKDFGAVGDGVADDTAAIQAAFDSGARSIIIPAGTYVTTGVEIKNGSVVEEVIGDGVPVLKLTAGLNRVALLVSKNFVRVENLELRSTGTKGDGLSTVGLKFISRAYTLFRNIRAYNFSLRGIQVIQCVYATFENLTIQGCTYGISFERDPSNNVQCTAYTVTGAYISGCTRGISQDGSGNAVYTQCIMEYCGDAVASEGAFHANGGGANLISCYWEANYRNIFAYDAGLQFVGKYELAAAAPDIVSYLATAFDLRGTTQIGSNVVKTRFLAPDDFSGYDLQFGTNLIAPVGGGSVRFGNTTTEEITGTATASTWTTVKAIPATEMTGAMQQRAAYMYTIYAGYSDLSTGFDFGVIFNDTLTSFSGSTPSWLRLNGQNLQVNIGSSSYGLYYKAVLHRIFPGVLI